MRWLNFETGGRMTNQVIHGDCMDVMREMEDNSIDTIITDPPYHLGSISKRFAKASIGDDTKTSERSRNGADGYARLATGFMGKSWDGGGIAFQPELWAEMLRVAKPGATLMAFGGTRTHHRLMVAIEDAGWEIRDCLMWLYGSGFPKSHNISKGIDRAAGSPQETFYEPNGKNNTHGKNWGGGETDITVKPNTEAAATWEGFGTGLKPAYEPIIYAQKPIDGTYANNAQVHGVAGLNIDGGRIGTEGWQRQDRNSPGGFKTDKFLGEAGNGKYSQPQDGYRESTNGRWPANVLLSHAEGCVRRGEKRVKTNVGWSEKDRDVKTPALFQGGLKKRSEQSPMTYADPNGLETVADWECVDGCPIRILDEQAGVRKSGKILPHHNGHGWTSANSNVGWKRESHDEYTQSDSSYGDKGSASRFFYTAKAPNREKWFFCQLCAQAYPNKERDDHAHDIDQGQRKHIIAHPTVKPLSILNYLCTLTKTPTGGIVLDPFAGSGTTGLACLETGRDFILIEKEADYYEIAKARVAAAMKEPRQAELW